MRVDVLIIGAGPAGSLAAALLQRRGIQTLVLEREQFPRFSIGESLLPQSMEYLEQAGMLKAVDEAGFQIKNGAAFACGRQYTEIDFSDKHSEGWSTTYEVPRAQFDHILALEAERQGAEIRYRHEVRAIDLSTARPKITVCPFGGDEYVVDAGFVLDASGFGRVLPRLLQLDKPSAFPVRAALFTHIADGIAPAARFDRNKILITVHAKHRDVWYWLIPFSGGRSSLGAVGRREFLAAYEGAEQGLKDLVEEDGRLSNLLANGRWDTPVRRLVGYASNVKSLWGRGYALLGNAGEFLDPIFSSGVTIALKSASLAAALLPRQIAGREVDWQGEFAAPLKQGVDTFRAFVESWYRGGLQRIIFHHRQPPDVRRMIAAILAGYAWDQSNPYVRQPRRRLAALEEVCAQD